MNTKSSLLTIGLELFSKSPYEAVGVQDIVEKANVTKPTLYHHFGSKLGFYQAVFEHYALPLFEIIVQKTQYNRDLTQNLNEISRSVLEFFIQNPQVYWLLEHAMTVSMDSEHNAFVTQQLATINQAIESLFEQAVEQHGNLKDKVALTTWLFIYAIRSEVYVVLTHKHPYSPDLPYKLVHQFMHGIFA